MIHTLSIAHRILSNKTFDEIYKNIELITGIKPRKVGEGCYVSDKLKEIGFTQIQLISKKVDGKYKYNFMQIKILLNPVKLIGLNKFELIKPQQIDLIKIRFVEQARKIHYSLPNVEHWIVDRIDYAININTPYVEEYIKLFQRGDKPRGFKELYCSTSKIRKQLEGSFYIFNNSVTVNFYNKENERLKEDFNKDGIKNLLRLEVQCKTSKTNTIKRKNKFDVKRLDYYLNIVESRKQLEYYYNKTIGTGEYYKLSEAIKLVQESKYTSSTKKKLIKVLKAINKHRSIWKARETSQYSVARFNNYLRQIRKLNINPVTIPIRWKVNKLGNILEKW